MTHKAYYHFHSFSQQSVSGRNIDLQFDDDFANLIC